jgi:protein SCO1/2
MPHPDPTGLRPPRAATLALALALAPGCDGPAPEAGPASPAAAESDADAGPVARAGATETIEYEGVVSIDHEEIPGLMPAMLMDFRLDDPGLLDDVIPGDEVLGTLEVDRDGRGRVSRMDLVDLVVTRPAPPPSSDEPPAYEPPPALDPGDPVPDFEMTTQRGEPLRLSDLEGRYVVLTFIFTRCPQPEFCPLMDRKFADLARRLSRSAERAGRVRLLSISFDPEYDTPEVLASHARRVGAEPPLWTFAVADHDELSGVAAPLGLSYAPMTDQIRHSLSTALIGPDGRLVRLETGNAWEPEELYGVIRGLIDAEGP